MPTVTQTTDRTAAERKRRQRERQRAAAAARAPLLFERADWQLFLRPETLAQKAGCEPVQIGRIVLKEVVDNALDTGSDNVTIDEIPGGWRVTDHGPGIAPADVAKLFAVNRPLLSSKLKRLPLRGMLGNGLRCVMGAVAAFNGTITVTSRGHRQTLAIDTITGGTRVVSNTLVRPADGTTVEITLPEFTGDEKRFAKLALIVAGSGTHYTGPSQPQWYGPEDLRELFARVTPPETTVTRIVREVFDLALTDDRAAPSLSAADVAALHHELCRLAGGRRVMPIGFIGNDADAHYCRVDDVTQGSGVSIPFCVEVRAGCERAERGEHTGHTVDLLVNRSPSIAPLWLSADSDGIWLRGCGINQVITGKRARYTMMLSLISPFVRLMNDGKTPFLDDFREAIRRAVQKAAGSAYRAMIRPPAKLTIVDAAWQVLPEAYRKASGNGQYPANARQIMYAARPAILRLAGVEKFGDSYFTQVLLPNFIAEHREECTDWDVVYDQRGHFVEPHTRRVVPLGTVQVRQYLGERPTVGPAVAFDFDTMFPTSGPQNRYRNILFCEKEGFDPLLEAARIAERFDIAPMSTKGMSVTAARQLLDALAKLGVENVLALHDFDVSGFSIFGTLGTSGRRYVFRNKVNVIDIGLRLADIEKLQLQSEPVPIKEDSLAAREETLREHGATEEEIDFLLGYDGEGIKRVELNAMASDVFVAFLERKLTEAGVRKVVPTGEVMQQHARRLIEQQLTREAIDDMRDELAAKVAARKLPRGLAGKVRKLLTEQPELPWDTAVALALGLG